MSRSQRRNQKQSKNRNQKRNKSQRGGDLTSEDQTKIVEMVEELKVNIQDMPVVEETSVVVTEGAAEGTDAEGTDASGADASETEGANATVGGRKSRRRKQRKNRKSQRKQKRR